jgi:hypothetical protein
MSALVSFLAVFASETVANDLRNISKHLDTFAMAETNPKFPKPEPKSHVSWLHSLLRLRPLRTSRRTWTHSPRLNETLNAPNPNQNRSFLGYICFWDFGQKSLYHQQALGHIRHGWPKPWKFCKLEPEPLSSNSPTQPDKSNEYLLTKCKIPAIRIQHKRQPADLQTLRTNPTLNCWIPIIVVVTDQYFVKKTMKQFFLL